MSYRIVGASFATEVELAQAVRSQLGGGAVWIDRNDYESQDGMRRALREAGRHEKVLATMVAKHLEDGDVRVRSGAVAVSDELARILGADALAGIFEAHEGSLRGIPPQGHTISQPDLGWQLLVSIATQLRSAEERRAIELLRRDVFGERGTWLLGALARHDARWLLEHAHRAVPPKSLLGVLRASSGREERIALIRAMHWSEASVTEALSNPAWKHLPFPPAEVEHLRNVLGEQAKRMPGGST